MTDKILDRPKDVDVVDGRPEMTVKSYELQQLRLSSNDVQHVIQLTVFNAELALCQAGRQKRMHCLQ